MLKTETFPLILFIISPILLLALGGYLCCSRYFSRFGLCSKSFFVAITKDIVIAITAKIIFPIYRQFVKYSGFKSPILLDEVFAKEIIEGMSAGNDIIPLLTFSSQVPFVSQLVNS